MAGDKNVVVCFGATGTVGRAFLDFVLKQDVMGSSIKVVAVGTDKAVAEALAGEHKERLIAAECDARDIKQVQAVLDKAADGLLGVVNLIGEFVMEPAENLAAEDLMAMMQENLTCAFNVLKAGAPALAEAGGGNMCCVGATIVNYGIKHHEGFGAIKGAIEAMHRNAAATWAAKNVRINCVAPGLIESPSSAQVSQDPEAAAASREMYPLKRLATPEDVAWAACWLTHPKTTFTTGVALPVDGGLHCLQTAGLATTAAAAASGGGGGAKEQE